ncbi:DUF4411 family protein [Denitromonas iodatirespirans]|uniref:DUF4411 family protein n=1 Tax=Denitromonas iodatirespirans TaxID=2795389 RepID=A0A944DC01_DENI1|nr:DUF4411 family protein [Denitromonas iodatirespirans]MBT0964005.1 DUF4411 family protein [Denitromonas iodatirespirans]
MNYLLDANTFIEAKNRYYGMTVCPAYWEWLLLQNGGLEIASISEVRTELTDGKDDLAAWARDNKQLFLDVADDDTQSVYADIVNFLSGEVDKMLPGALDEFLRGADPWLVGVSEFLCVRRSESLPELETRFSF